jgi:hypothetical protein
VAKHNKRTISTLKILIEKFGDVRLSEALNRESKRRPGRRRSWDLDRLLDVYLDVEAARANDMDLRGAREVIAMFYGVSRNVVEKRHAEACKRFDRTCRKRMAETLDLHLHGRPNIPLLPGRPRLIEFLRNHGRRAAKTRSIQ